MTRPSVYTEINSAIHQWDRELAEALAAEGAGGYPVVFEEAIEGAGRFAGGAGRHGAFNKPSETS
ncbi:hypothetical protein [Marinobacter sp. ATCH36]|uniref:hypothetical protein n=1 Tax=Marinobacter sp. ATCH36 TaxID=2945106 RepID=UPI0020201046|nr:hypothetical protein [Marinobacter sp. ATCH36]MCL7942408.1 hypothetical protein [Marinobacter sp. ATCH36]